MVQDPRKINPALRKKYDVRGPRYTSYPPATHFHEIDMAELIARWEERNNLKPDPGLSFYIHIPFCRTRCLFCGCHTFVGKGDQATNDYLQAMENEIILTAETINPDRLVHQLAMGGGTPNFLSAEQIHKLLGTIKATYSIANNAELSVEIDPRTATKEKLDAFLEEGFNRFSLGVQDFSPDVVSVVRRGQDLMQIEEVTGYLRDKGCQAINFDLIYGLPHQSIESAQGTARQVIALKPSRIATYSYAHVPWIQPHQKALERHGLIEPDTKASLFLTMMDEFIQAGYQYIGMDHFATEEDSLAQALKSKTLRRNFMGYTTGRGLDMLAFGASAISSIGSSYSQSHKKLTNYQDSLGKNKLPLSRGFLLNNDDVIRRELLLELFCNFYADLDKL